jgi:hypothetical protein
MSRHVGLLRACARSRRCRGGMTGFVRCGGGLQHIARVERPRCPYSGAVVVAANDGALDAGLVVRTFRGERQPVAAYRRRDRRRRRPNREYKETCEKLCSIAPYPGEKR